MIKCLHATWKIRSSTEKNNDRKASWTQDSSHHLDKTSKEHLRDWRHLRCWCEKMVFMSLILKNPTWHQHHDGNEKILHVRFCDSRKFAWLVFSCFGLHPLLPSRFIVMGEHPSNQQEQQQKQHKQQPLRQQKQHKQQHKQRHRDSNGEEGQNQKKWPREGWGPEGWHPEGWGGRGIPRKGGDEGWEGLRGVGGQKGGGPEFRALCFFTRLKISLFVLSLGVFSLNFGGVFEAFFGIPVNFIPIGYWLFSEVKGGLINWKIVLTFCKVENGKGGFFNGRPEKQQQQQQQQQRQQQQQQAAATGKAATKAA